MMWDKFAPRLRRSIFAALEEAGRHDRDEATGDDLLVAIARDHVSAAAFILDHAGVDRAALVQRLTGVDLAAHPRRANAISSSCMDVLGVAVDQAAIVDDSHVGTEHVLAALARIGKGRAADALAACGFTYDLFIAGRRAWIDQGMPRSQSQRIAREGLPRVVAKPKRLLSLAWKVFVQLSLGHPKFVTNPYPLYAKLRQRWPVREDPIVPAWVITRYVDVLAVLRDARFAKDPYLAASLPPRVREQLELPADPEAAVSGEPLAMLFIDPPRHTKVRSIFNKGFTPRAMQLLRPRIDQIASKRIDRIANAREFDVMRELAFPLPTIVIAELLGFPPEDYPKLKKWSDDFAAALTINPTVSQTAASARSREELRDYFDLVVERVKQKPGENLISTLLASGVEEGQLTRQEFFANIALLMAAGHETTSNLIGNGVLALLRSPDQLNLLREDPSLITSAVEECLRFDSPVQWNSRVATEDIELSGVTLPRGQIVLASLGAANRDPEIFPNPDRFDIRRADNKHLAFGYGNHYCIGAALARMEGEIAIGALVRRFSKLRLARRNIRWRKGVIFRGPEELLVRID